MAQTTVSVQSSFDSFLMFLCESFVAHWNLVFKTTHGLSLSGLTLSLKSELI